MGTSSQPTRILVVDDAEEVRTVLRDLLEALGYQATMAEDGETALAAAEESPPDAVLLDISMPGIDGLEVCRRLRAGRRTAAVPILLVTAIADLETRLQGFEAGADDYVTKPFELQELAVRLRAHLELARARAHIAEMRGVFATIRALSHDFNNPLQFIVGGVHLLQRAEGGDSSIDRSEAMDLIGEGTKRLAELARHLVTITEPVFKDSPIGPMLDVDASR